MRIEYNPRIKVTSEDRHYIDVFCAKMETLEEQIQKCNEYDSIYQMIEENICLDWDTFLDVVIRFTNFIKSCEEED